MKSLAKQIGFTIIAILSLLLPEGFTRQCVANNIHSDPDDYISILRELGSECLGSKIAMRIYDELESGFEKALHDAASELLVQGFSDAQNMANQIMNWRKMARSF